MDIQNTDLKIPKRILNTLLSSLSAGVVPRIGAPYIAIGRAEEINSLLDNLDTIADGGSACRFLIGRYGSGKSFLIQLIRGRALERGFICADADLSPERRLTGGNGAGLATYKELMINLACKASPDGNALPTVLSRHLALLKASVVAEGVLPEDSEFASKIKARVISVLTAMESDVGGFDFARVLGEYYAAELSDNSERKTACLRFLRGEFANKTEANAALGFRVSEVVDDDNWYNYIKLFANFTRIIGYSGFAVFIDECVNLYKIPNRISREANYEKLLSIFNDTLQGKAKNLGVFFGGTPQFLEDTRRGLFSYEALKSRLADSKYSALGYQSLSSPVIRLRVLSGNELLALAKRLCKLYSMKTESEPRISDEQIAEFIKISKSRPGAEELITPREITRDFLTLLAILDENPDASFEQLTARLKLSSPADSDEPQENAVSNDSSAGKIGLFDIDI